MLPRSASSSAGTIRSSDVPAPEPTRTVSFDLMRAFPHVLLLRSLGAEQRGRPIRTLAWSISSAYVCWGQFQKASRNMNLRHMEVFHAIMRTGSVTGAARALNVTQPAVSAVLKHCETQLKMKLFA